LHADQDQDDINKLLKQTNTVEESSDFMATLENTKKKLGEASAGSRVYFKTTDQKYAKQLKWMNELSKN